MNPKVILILLAMLLATPCFAPGECGVVATAQTSTSKKKNTSVSSKKSSAPAKKSSASAKKSAAPAKRNQSAQKAAPAKKGSKRGSRTGSRKQAAAKGESSADVKRQQEATQREISDTKKQIQLNDASIKKGVDELGRLQGDIGESKERVKSTAAEVAGLSAKISGLETQVSSEEKQLQRLRTEYLKAIKKMRAAGKGNSRLAFIFSSSSFNQALRRMRYLKQFSEWKERQSAEIAGRVNHLKSQRNLLSKSLSAKDEALRKQRNAQNELEKQYARQDALVVELRANGEALNAHLAKKQAEANALRNRISSLIAAEEQQRRAREEEERRAREAAEAQARREQEAREAQARREAEAAEARERDEARARAEAQAKEKTEKAAGNTSETVVAETKQASRQQKSVAAKKETKSDKAASRKQSSRRRKDKDKRNEHKSVAAEKKQERKSVEVTKVESGKSGDYASARRRKPRSEAASKASAKKQPATAAASGGGSFEKMRGSLPRPVSGSFRITSPFGRHALPELPGVVYDNPGIDAQVAAGATAQAVYGGKVSGVYVIPGFSTVVIVNHGSYYTVYGNIASPSVKVGDNVKQGQGLGRLAVDEEDSGHSSIHFEVWRNREKLNPSDWIR